MPQGRREALNPISANKMQDFRNFVLHNCILKPSLSRPPSHGHGAGSARPRPWRDWDSSNGRALVEKDASRRAAAGRRRASRGAPGGVRSHTALWCAGQCGHGIGDAEAALSGGWRRAGGASEGWRRSGPRWQQQASFDGRSLIEGRQSPRCIENSAVKWGQAAPLSAARVSRQRGLGRDGGDLECWPESDKNTATGQKRGNGMIEHVLQGSIPRWQWIRNR